MQVPNPTTAIAPAAPNPSIQLLHLIRWSVQGVGPALPLVLIVQAMIGTSIIIGIITGQLYYGFSFAIDYPVLVAASLLTSAMATSVGYAVAMSTPRIVAMMVSQILAFVSMMFAPINYTADVLPNWLQAVHKVLPFEAAGNLIRAGLLAGQYQVSLHDSITLVAWTVLGLAITARVLMKRD